MIRDSDRRLARVLLRLGAFRVTQPRDDPLGVPRLRPRWGWCWLWNIMRDRQAPDDRWHAPACPANRWSGIELVVRPCSCRSRPRLPSREDTPQ
jgi:hypothetical protein